MTTPAASPTPTVGRRRRPGPVNPAIRKVGIGITVLILVLVAQLSYLQIFDAANSLNHNPHNSRPLLADADKTPAGDIVTADGTVVAHSVPVSDGTAFKYLREYPTASLFAQVVGYQSFIYGNTGVEKSYNDDLTGQSLQLQLHSIRGLLSGANTTGTVVLSLRADAQREAQAALGFQRGSVVLLNVQTRRRSSPCTRTRRSTRTRSPPHNAQVTQADFTALNRDPNQPALPRAYRELYPPGSSFKPVHHVGGPRGRGRHPEHRLPGPQRAHAPPDVEHPEELRWRVVRRDLHRELHRSHATPPSGSSASSSGTSSCPAWRSSGSAPPRPSTCPGPVSSTAPPPGRSPDNPQFALAGIGQGAWR